MFGLPISASRVAEIIVITAIVLMTLYVFYRLNLFKKE
jgi:hypothetical protein